VRQVVGAATGTLVVLVGPGEPTMVADRGAARHLSPADIDSALDRLDDVRHLHLSGYALFDGGRAPMAGRHALAAARDWGLTTSIDAASAAPLRRAGVAEFLEGSRGVDLLFANAVETTVLAESTADPMTQARALARILAGAGAGAGAAAGAGHPAGGAGGTGSPCAVVVKLGPAGALWAGSDGRTARVNASPAAAVDPTGAGDAFAAGVLAAWLSGADPVGSLRAGAELGAEAVSTIGPRPP
jgi:sugar/nucleoside kinase (ribokinase family)